MFRKGNYDVLGIDMSAYYDTQGEGGEEEKLDWEEGASNWGRLDRAHPDFSCRELKRKKAYCRLFRST